MPVQYIILPALDGIEGSGCQKMMRLKLLFEQQKETIVLPEPSSLFESAILSRGYFPSKTFLCSVLGHLALLATMILLSIYRHIPEPPSMVEHITFIDLRVPNVLFLPPMMAPGKQGMRSPARKPAARAAKTAEPRASNSKGLSYPGPQTIVSDPPNPTNQIQTVLQPDIENPPVLVPPIPLPNIVQIAEAIPAAPKIPEPPEPPKETTPPETPKPAPVAEIPPPPKAPEPAMVLPALELAPQMRLEKPRIILPPSIPPLIEAKPSERPEKIELPNLIKASAIPPPPEPAPEPKPELKPEPKPASKPVEAPKKQPETANAEAVPQANEKSKEPPAVQTPAATEGKKNLLALTPMPAAAKEPVRVPAGEARGRFAISPEPNLTVSEKEPGAKTGIPSDAIGIGNKNPAPSADEMSKPPAVATGVEAKTSNPKSAAGGNQGGNNGRGTQPGPGSGNSGSSPVAGSGTGKATTKKPFSGITIVGGSFAPGDSADNPPITPARKPLQTSYGLNIISTENSGGGLPFFGVFAHEQIYTVYLDMRQVEMDLDPSWTLEFAVIPKSDSQAGSIRNQQGLILPFPAEKVPPVFPADVVRKNLNKMVIVYGVVNTEGKMEQLSVKDTPDNSLTEPVLKALGKWIFRPAQLNGELVAVKLLMGIPLWLPQ